MRTFYALAAFFVAHLCNAQTLILSLMTSGIIGPTEIANAGDNRLFVCEVIGNIKIINPDGSTVAQPFLSLDPADLALGGERGLIGLAFHPQYSTNGYFFITYTRTPDGAIVLKRYQRDPSDANLALASSGVDVLVVEHDAEIHNGGEIHFGPDGNLYIALGDGSLPIDNAQNIDIDKGKILRINVDNLPYTVPANNMFVGVPGNDEIWSMGLRNPWRFSFDRLDGSMWIADVGENSFEEINKVTQFDSGKNFGWPCYEANSSYADWACTQPQENYTFPIMSYAHGLGACSITGGYVYRGTAYPALYGKYVFSDFCASGVKIFDPATNQITDTGALVDISPYFATLGEDVNGELYVASYALGLIYRIQADNMATQSFSKNTVLYPNPAHGTIHVALPGTAFPVGATIRDLSGKTFGTQKLMDAAQGFLTDGLQSGLYILSLTDHDGNRFEEKVIVN